MNTINKDFWWENVEFDVFGTFSPKVENVSNSTVSQVGYPFFQPYIFVQQFAFFLTIVTNFFPLVADESKLMEIAQITSIKILILYKYENPSF